MAVDYRLGVLLSIASCLCFAGMNVVTKYLGSMGVHVYEMVFWRSLITLVYVAAQALWLKQSFATRFPVSHLTRGTAGGVSMICIFYVMTHLPVATAATLSSTSVLFFALLSLLFTVEKPNRFTWLAVCAGFGGVLFLLKPDMDGREIVSVGIGLLSGLLTAIAMLKVQELGKAGEPAWRIVLYFSLSATLIGLVMSSLTGWHALTLPSGLLLLLLGIFGTLGQITMTKAYQVGDKFTTSVLSYLTLVFTALGGFWLFGERLDAWSVLGIFLIAGSGVAVKMPTGKRN